MSGSAEGGLLMVSTSQGKGSDKVHHLVRYLPFNWPTGPGEGNHFRLSHAPGMLFSRYTTGSAHCVDDMLLWPTVSGLALHLQPLGLAMLSIPTCLLLDSSSRIRSGLQLHFFSVGVSRK